jgi:glycosyltransferase involved in cell wall biosynthesis
VSDRLTILHLTHEGRGAGSSISIALLAREQAARGHRVLVGCPAGSYLAARVGAAVEHVPLAFEAGDGSTRALEQLARRTRADVVNAHSSRDRAACRRLRFAGRLPGALVMTRRGMPMSTPLSAVLSGFAADRTIAVSRPVARALVRRGTPPWRVAVVPNAVDLARIEGAVSEAARRRARELLGSGGPVIGVVSRRKDHETLLRALRWVTTPVTLCLIGFEPDAALRQLWPAVSRRPSAEQRIVWLPFQDDVRPFYDRFDVAVMPGRHEGLSQGLLEAMALGKAVVAVRAGGNTDVVTDGVDGLLVPPRDPRALGAALQRLLESGELRRRLGGAAGQRARHGFTVERTVTGTEAVYRAAIARRNGQARGNGGEA